MANKAQCRHSMTVNTSNFEEKSKFRGEGRCPCRNLKLLPCFPPILFLSWSIALLVFFLLTACARPSLICGPIQRSLEARDHRTRDWTSYTVGEKERERERRGAINQAKGATAPADSFPLTAILNFSIKVSRFEISAER